MYFILRPWLSFDKLSIVHAALVWGSTSKGALFSLRWNVECGHLSLRQGRQWLELVHLQDEDEEVAQLFLFSRSSAVPSFCPFWKLAFCSFLKCCKLLHLPLWSPSLLKLARNSFCGLWPREPIAPGGKKKSKEFGVAGEHSVCWE